nr:vegetative cell wall protein gp1-like [Lolium perenne]
MPGEQSRRCRCYEAGDADPEGVLQLALFFSFFLVQLRHASIRSAHASTPGRAKQHPASTAQPADPPLLLAALRAPDSRQTPPARPRPRATPSIHARASQLPPGQAAPPRARRPLAPPNLRAKRRRSTAPLSSAAPEPTPPQARTRHQPPHALPTSAKHAPGSSLARHALLLVHRRCRVARPGGATEPGSAGPAIPAVPPDALRQCRPSHPGSAGPDCVHCAPLPLALALLHTRAGDSTLARSKSTSKLLPLSRAPPRPPSRSTPPLPGPLHGRVRASRRRTCPDPAARLACLRSTSPPRAAIRPEPGIDFPALLLRLGPASTLHPARQPSPACPISTRFPAPRPQGTHQPGHQIAPSSPARISSSHIHARSFRSDPITHA